MHAACLLFALPKIMCSSVFLFLFAHLLLSTQKGLHWQPHLKSHHLWIRNRLSKYWGRRKIRPEIVHLQRVGSLILHNQALQKDQQMKTVHFHSYWYQWGIGGVPLMFWHLLFLSTARWPRQTELPPSCWAELRDAGGQQEGRCQSREIHLHTYSGGSEKQRSHWTILCTWLKPTIEACLSALVCGRREATANWQLSGQATGLVVLCSCVFRTPGRCAIPASLQMRRTMNHNCQFKVHV